MGRKKTTTTKVAWTTVPSRNTSALANMLPPIEKCRHYNEHLKLPSGVIVFPSSVVDRTEDEPSPDLGLYLERSWRPTGLALTVDWPDYYEPRHLEAAYVSICYAYNKAEIGLTVEVSCLGGHGRTGTALACMAVIGGLPAQEAIDWVRGKYCSKAIESPEQEWYVTWFLARHNNEELPPRPKKIASGSRKKKTKGEPNKQQVVAWQVF